MKFAGDANVSGLGSHLGNLDATVNSQVSNNYGKNMNNLNLSNSFIDLNNKSFGHKNISAHYSV